MDFNAPLDSVKNQILKDIIQHGAISTNKSLWPFITSKTSFILINITKTAI